ncbi:MAG: isopeptide-forming domain-containing fimbrial protein [Ruminococcaceae bacterium]|nr:isopeptide-forming domain-containing fimbrial protein [Oscillospiraceae bacterium]
MKKTSKIFSVVLALVLVFAMAIPAFAADGKITISNAVAGQDYTIYKMFDFTAISGGNAGATDAKGFYTIADDSPWAAFLAGDGAPYLKADEANGTIVWNGAETPERKAELAKLAVAYAKDEDNGINGTTITADTTTVEFTGLDFGYYAIDSSLGTVCGLTNTNPSFETHEKNTQPTIDKKVQEDSDNSWGKVNDAQIGDTVNFETTVKAKANSTNYVVHDKMEAGLTLKADTIAIAGLEKDVDYTVATGCGDGCTFEITFTQEYLDSITTDRDIVITYSAVLNKDAEIVTDTNDNTTWLSYGDKATVTAESKTQTLTYYFNLKKTDVDGKQLEGAEFTLKDATDKEISFVAIDGGYRVATAEDANTTTTIVAGNVVIKGLDADTYSLTETKAPAGYNLLDDSINVTVNAATTGNTITFAPVNQEVVNKTGGLLPETGGIGTTIFYVVGLVLVLGAAVLLITKKRMSCEA